MGVQKAFGTLLRRVVGSRNDRLVKRLWRVADGADALEAEVRALSPDALRAKTDEFRERLAGGESEDSILPEVFAVLREASRRAQQHRHFPCQLIGGKVLYNGRAAEMKTGEGKTIVCHLAAYVKSLQGMKVHIVTVNDYLVQRDAEFAAPIFDLLGLTVGYIQALNDPSGREGIRQAAYRCHLTYGTASEFGFDYLRDNMKLRAADQVQCGLDYAIIDEVDSILIDEARTPLIISGPAHDDVSRYKWANHIAMFLEGKQQKANAETRRRLERWGDAPPQQFAMHQKFQDAINRFRIDPCLVNDEEAEAIGHTQYYVVKLERKDVHLTHEGVSAAQDEAKIGSFYVGTNMDRPHLIEQALRARVTFQRDRDYVVKDGEVIIVDEGTGRLMIGRQWSDGLHQAVEAKEGVTVKEETQTMATVTIQNFFKMYKCIAGMTGTAMTEANEFNKIYKLDVVEIPTNRPVNRIDFNDRLYRATKFKYSTIVDEIYHMRRRGRPADPFLLTKVLKKLRPIVERAGQSTAKIDDALVMFDKADDVSDDLLQALMDAYDESMGELATGRPVLVGTTSVEKSEMLSNLLTRTYSIEHEVLNAKNHAREAEIVAKAGHRTEPERGHDKTPLGNVTIATNMAGRGTDIKLEAGVVYPKCKVPLPDGQGGGTTESASTGVALDVIDEGEKELYPPGATKCCIRCAEYDAATNCAHCFKSKLDPRFPAMGRTVCPLNVPCGLHIIGTERHEARRIDNQLKGRSGRQGDPGSSRFFLSLEDDLMKLYFPEGMIKLLGKAVEEGMPLEHKAFTSAIEKAQTRVEERNFSARKNLLEWDEPLDYQRKEFYAQRQRILVGDDLRSLIFHTIDESTVEAVHRFLGPEYRQECVLEWCRSHVDPNLDISIGRLDLDDLPGVQETIRRAALSEAMDRIRTSIGEYIDEEADPRDWDVGGLLQWGQRAFAFSETQNQLRKMAPHEIEDALMAAAEKYFDEFNLEPIHVYADENYPRSVLVDWARTKFNIEIKQDELAEKSVDEVTGIVLDKVNQAYQDREVSYPVEVCIERAMQDGAAAGGDSAHVADGIAAWVNAKYQLGWTVDDVQGKSPQHVFDELLAMNRRFLVDGEMERQIDEAIAGKSDEEAIEWGRNRFGRAWNERLFAVSCNGSVAGGLRAVGREMLRWELTRLENFVLLRLYDQAWKDHLLEMDHLRHAIMQRPLGGDQTHPQSQYAIEGREYFDKMWSRVREKVTDMIFKVKMTGGGPGQFGVPGVGGPRLQMVHADATGAGFAGAVTADQAAAMRAQGVEQKAETIRRDQPKVKRNDPCPCGSGKKYKHCCGRNA